MKILITENQKKSLKNNLMDIVNKFGFVTAAKAVGTRENLIKILFNNKIKRYLDRVVIELVKGTKIDYDNNLITFPFYPLYPYSVTHPSSLHYYIYPSYYFVSSLKEYCKNTFELTEDEIDYVSKEYKEIIKDKMENG